MPEMFQTNFTLSIAKPTADDKVICKGMLHAATGVFVG